MSRGSVIGPHVRIGLLFGLKGWGSRCSGQWPFRCRQHLARRRTWPIWGCIFLAECLCQSVRAGAVTLNESFTEDPVGNGWAIAGDSTLFQWNAAAGFLSVSWDSSKPNSYFYHSLGTVVSADDDFALAFDLRLLEVKVGLTPAKPFTFELAVGLINQAEARGTNFVRGSGSQSPDLVEFDYFPDSGFGATISPVLVSNSDQFVPSFTFPLELTVNDLFHVQMTYAAATRTLTTAMLRDGSAFGPVHDVILSQSFTGFAVDAVAISSYNDAGADGSLLAQGTIDNVLVSFPAPPLGRIEGAFFGQVWTVQLTGQTNWIYTLERSQDLTAWLPAAPAVAGIQAQQALHDESLGPRPERAFYRVRAERRP